MPLNLAYRRDDRSDSSLVRSLLSTLKRKPSYPHYTKTSELLASISCPIAADDNCTETVKKHYRPSSVIDLPILEASTPVRRTQSRPAIPIRTTSSPLTTFPSITCPPTPPPTHKSKASVGSLYSLRSFSSVHLNNLGAKLSGGGGSTSDLLNFPTPPPRPAPLAQTTPTPPRPPRATRPPTPTSPLAINKKNSGSLYSLKSFSSAHLHTFSSKFGSSTDIYTPPPSMPATALRRTRSTTRAPSASTELHRTWTSTLPETAPQLEALDVFAPFTFPLLSLLNAAPIGIPGVIMEDIAEEEKASPLLPFSAALDLDCRPSYVPLPPSPPSSDGNRWSHRGSVAPSFWSGSGSDSDETSCPGSAYSSASSFPGCVTPTSHGVDVPLNPWRIPVVERRKGSVVFPSRKNSSCISLGVY